MPSAAPSLHLAELWAVSVPTCVSGSPEGCVFVQFQHRNCCSSGGCLQHFDKQARKHGTKCGGDVLCRRSGGQSPPEAEAILDFCMHNFDLILNHFCFARATSGWLMLRNGSCLSMK